MERRRSAPRDTGLVSAALRGALREGRGARKLNHLGRGCKRAERREAMTFETKRPRARGNRMLRRLVRARAGCSIRAASTTRAASASSPTSRARKSHQLVKDALAILENLEHRGAVGADPIAGDGAGILIQIPHEFLREECAALEHQAAEARPLCRRPHLHAAGRAAARALRARVDAHHPRGGPGVPGLALGAGRQQLPVRDGQGRWSRCTGRSSSAGRRR